jgi:hypothetical protein
LVVVFPDIVLFLVHAQAGILAFAFLFAALVGF